MKIQNKSARLWIGLGLLGLILFGIKSVARPFGGPLVEMFSDAGIIFLLVGLYLESKSKKKNDSRGFIPILAAMIIGILAVAGGTTAIILDKKASVVGPEAPGTALDKPLEVRDNKTDVEPIKGVVSKSTTQKKEIIKIEVKPEAKTTKNINNDPVVEEQTQATPVKIHPGVAIIDAFLSNPTLENLKTFCTTAKNAEGYSEEKVLNQDRTDYEMKMKSLYQEAIGVCSLALGEAPGNERYAWTYYSDSYLLPFTDLGESDDLRKKKIEYNAILASIPPYKLFAYDKDSIKTDHIVSTPREAVEAIIYSGSSDKLKNSLFKLFKMSFVVPEKKLQSIRTQLLRTP